MKYIDTLTLNTYIHTYVHTYIRTYIHTYICTYIHTYMDGRKAPGEDGITGEIYKHTFNIFPKSITALYNGCLRQGVFPKRWKNAKIIPISKPGKENSEEASKYRPISLINIGGKVLEKALINRINYHVYSTDYLNHNQYGFTPQTSTIDAIKAATEFIEEGFSRGEITATVSLDVEV